MAAFYLHPPKIFRLQLIYIKFSSKNAFKDCSFQDATCIHAQSEWTKKKMLQFSPFQGNTDKLQVWNVPKVKQ